MIYQVYDSPPSCVGIYIYEIIGGKTRGKTLSPLGEATNAMKRMDAIHPKHVASFMHPIPPPPPPPSAATATTTITTTTTQIGKGGNVSHLDNIAMTPSPS